MIAIETTHESLSLEGFAVSRIRDLPGFLSQPSGIQGRARVLAVPSHFEFQAARLTGFPACLCSPAGFTTASISAFWAST
jgi:hypothetical protein